MTRQAMVSVEDLRRAYRAATSTEPARHGLSAASEVRPADTRPSGTATTSTTTVLVVGCLGSAGASTTALALATVLGSARVVECCSVASSGLCAASSAELGAVGDGWLRGSRDDVLIERRADRLDPPATLPQPPPAPAAATWTVLDCPRDVDAVLAADGWLGDLARTLPAVVVVTRPTVPGMRRLETAIDLIGDDRAVPVVIGVEKRWPKPAVQAMGPATRALHGAGRLVALPHIPSFAVLGLTPEPLPAALLTSTAALVTVLKGLL